MAATSPSVAFQKAQQAFTSFPRWEVVSAESATLFGMIKSSMKSFSRVVSPGHPMGNYSRILTVHHVSKLLLFFYYRSTHWKFADSHRHCVREVISILNSPQMVKHWPSPEIRKESSQSTRSQFPEERNNVLPRMLHRSGVLRGLQTVAKSFTQVMVLFGR